MRLFFGIPAAPDLVSWVGEALQPFRRFPGVKWVEPENLHFTLRFLGEVEEARVPALEEAARRAASRSAPFDLELGPAGAFPHFRRPRVLVYRLARGTEELEGLAGEIEREISQAGFEPEDRPFKAHLTVGRVRGDRSRLSGEVFEEIPSGSGRSQKVVSFALVHSRLTPQGPVYTALKEIALSGSM
jgi:2'-5' RNA ligase